MALLTVTFYDIICYYLRREQKSPEVFPRGFEPVLLAERTKSPEFSPRGFEPVLLRREQDSNLRAGFAGYTLSRRASSATRAPLQKRRVQRYDKLLRILLCIGRFIKD